jgi:hypothetical protein
MLLEFVANNAHSAHKSFIQDCPGVELFLDGIRGELGHCLGVSLLKGF